MGKYEDVFFTPSFLQQLNQAYLDFDKYNKQNIGKIQYAGTLREILIHPQIIEDFKEILDIEVYFLNKINNKYVSGFGTGVYHGKNIIFLNPQQPSADYVPGFIHEMQHLKDKLEQQKLYHAPPNFQEDPQEYKRYENHPSEQKAREKEQYYLDLLNREKE